MQVSVNLQDMHSYSPIMLAVIIMIILIFIGTIIVILVKKYSRPVQVVPKEITALDKENIKKRYIGYLVGLEKKCREGKLSNRKAYQELSKILRHYVYETTGVKVHNYTLDEIKKTNIGGLYTVVDECYAPEFSVDKNGEIYTSIAKARKVIEEWN